MASSEKPRRIGERRLCFARFLREYALEMPHARAAQSHVSLAFSNEKNRGGTMAAAPEWQSWESRWAAYLDGLAAEEADDDDDDQGDGPPLPAGFGAPSVDVSDGDPTAPREPEPVEPERVGGVQPTMKPRRPGQKPGFEADREREIAQQAQAWAEKQREQQQQREREQEEKRRQAEARRRQESEREQEAQRQRQQQRQQHRSQSSARGAPPPGAEGPSGGFGAAAAARAAPKTPKKAAVGRFFDSFGAFEAAFAEWDTRTSGADKLALAEIPFPPLKDPAGLVAGGLLRGGDAAKRKALLRTALLRWHPDKWMAVIGKVRKEDHAELGRRLGTITQTLVEQKDMA